MKSIDAQHDLIDGNQVNITDDTESNCQKDNAIADSKNQQVDVEASLSDFRLKRLRELEYMKKDL